MLSLPGELLQDLVAMTTGPHVALIDIDLDGETHLRLAFHIEDVVYDGATYSASSGTPAVLNLAKDAAMPVFTLVLNHIERDITPYLRQDGGLEGQDLTVTIVNLDRLTCDHSEWSTTYTILGHSDTEEAINFEIGGANLYNERFPTRRYMAGLCDVDFGEALCGYDGADTSCTHTLSACRAKSNSGRFGGSPGLRPQTLRVV